ncbi:hypothetical protein HIM_05298 [Hirsutella minnesotensis 3608]|uniref:MARVEL domain-containing protein n=1 Tax=Hirsutella minnesotensis 3608 TaxID=1043627 RepID=A0A0F8A0I8_9HYPO|nr:hypothetical protein HIM_05298 [Hirsutella minnesotensis 3608]
MAGLNLPVPLVTIAYGALALFLIIELGLTGYAVDKTDNFWVSPPSQISFMLFNSIWSILVLTYVALTPRFMARLYHGLVGFALLAVTALFWFAGSIALAVLIGVPRCRGRTFCQSVQAAVAFGFFIWAIFTALAALAGLSAFRGGANADGAAKSSTPETATV